MGPESSQAYPSDAIPGTIQSEGLIQLERPSPWVVPESLTSSQKV